MLQLPAEIYERMLIELKDKVSTHIQKKGNEKIKWSDPCGCDLKSIQHFLWDYENYIYLVHFTDEDNKPVTMKIASDELSQKMNTFYRVRTVDPGQYIEIHKDPCACEQTEYMLRNTIPLELEDSGEIYLIHRFKYDNEARKDN